MPLRVLQLGPYPPPQGGVSRNILAIRDRLRERGDTCSVIATSRSTKVIDEPDVHHPRSARDLISLVGGTDHDILHLHMGGHIGRRVLSLAVAASTLGKCPVLTLHSGGYAGSKDGVRARPRSVRGRIFRQFERVIAVNDELAQVFRRYGVDDDRISVIAPHMLTPPDPSVKLPPELQEFCSRHSPLLISVGGLQPEYEPIFLIDAMRAIREKHPDAGLVIVGDGSLRADVDAAVSREAPGAVYIAGDLPHGETLRLITRADQMLRITLFDGDAISVREALYVGTPVIATANGMRPEGVMCVPQGDKAALCQAVSSLTGKRQFRPRHLEPDLSNIDAVLSVYDSLI